MLLFGFLLLIKTPKLQYIHSTDSAVVLQRWKPLGTIFNPADIDWEDRVNAPSVYKTTPPYIGAGKPRLGGKKLRMRVASPLTFLNYKGNNPSIYA